MDASGLYQRSMLMRRLLRFLLRHAEMVTACSHQTLSEAAEFTGVELGPRGSVIFNGVDVAAFRSSTPPVDDVPPYLFGIGRLVREKGFDVLIDAFARLPSSDLRLVIAGEGPQRSELEAMAERVGVRERVSFVGRTDRAQTIHWFLDARSSSWRHGTSRSASSTSRRWPQASRSSRLEWVASPSSSWIASMACSYRPRTPMRSPQPSH